LVAWEKTLGPVCPLGMGVDRDATKLPGMAHILLEIITEE